MPDKGGDTARASRDRGAAADLRRGRVERRKVVADQPPPAQEGYGQGLFRRGQDAIGRHDARERPPGRNRPSRTSFTRRAGRADMADGLATDGISICKQYNVKCCKIFEE